MFPNLCNKCMNYLTMQKKGRTVFSSSSEKTNMSSQCAFKTNTYLNHTSSDRYFIIRCKLWQWEILILRKHTFPLPNEHWNNLKSTKSRLDGLYLMSFGFNRGNDHELNKTSFTQIALKWFIFWNVSTTNSPEKTHNDQCSEVTFVTRRPPCDE